MGGLAAFSQLVTEDTILSMPRSRSLCGAGSDTQIPPRSAADVAGAVPLAVAVRARCTGSWCPSIKSAQTSLTRRRQITLISARHGRIVQLIRFASQSFFSHFGLLDRLPIADA